MKRAGDLPDRRLKVPSDRSEQPERTRERRGTDANTGMPSVVGVPTSGRVPSPQRRSSHSEVVPHREVRRIERTVEAGGVTTRSVVKRTRPQDEELFDSTKKLRSEGKEAQESSSTAPRSPEGGRSSTDVIAQDDALPRETDTRLIQELLSDEGNWTTQGIADLANGVRRLLEQGVVDLRPGAQRTVLKNAHLPTALLIGRWTEDVLRTRRAELLKRRSELKDSDQNPSIADMDKAILLLGVQQCCFWVLRKTTDGDLAGWASSDVASVKRAVGLMVERGALAADHPLVRKVAADEERVEC